MKRRRWHHPEACEWHFVAQAGKVPKSVREVAFKKARRNKSGSSQGRYKGIKWFVMPSFNRECPGYKAAREARRRDRRA